MKIGRKIALGLGGVVALVIVTLVVALTFINSIARKGIEVGATYALGVKTSLTSARVGVFSGSVSLASLKVANPQGFPAPHFMALGDGGVAVSLASINKDVIDVPTLTLDNLDVHLETEGGKSNYQVIIDNLGKLGSKDPNKPPAKGDETRLVIRELTITDVTVHADVIGVAAGIKTTSVTVPIKEIRLKNVGKTGTGVAGTGVTIGELTGIIVEAVLAAAVSEGGDLFPADLARDLTGRLKELDGLKEVGVEVVGKVGEAAKNIGKDFEPVVKEAGKAIEEAAKEGEKVLEGIGDLFNKKPKGKP